MYYYFIKYFNNGIFVSIPLSGLSLIFQDNYYKNLTNEQYTKIYKYICRFIDLKVEILKIIIIDHSHTGNSILSLMKILRNCNCTKFNNIPIEFCNLVDNKTHIGWITNINIKTHIIRGNYINNISGHTIPRLTPQIHFKYIILNSFEEMNNLLKKRDELIKGYILIKILEIYYKELV